MTNEFNRMPCDVHGDLVPGQVRVTISLKGYSDPTTVDKSLIFICSKERAEIIFRVAAETATKKWKGTHERIEKLSVDSDERDLHGE